MGLEKILLQASPYVGKALRMARPAATHVGKNLWKYGAGLEGAKAIGRGEGPGGILNSAVGGASTAGLLQGGLGRGRHLMRGGLANVGLSPNQALLASSVVAPALAAGGTMLLGGQGGPASQAMGGVQAGGGNVLGAGAAMMNQRGVGPMGDPLGGLPPGTTAKMMGPEGNWWYQLDPGGVAAGNRLGRVLGSQADASVINTIGDALYGQTERTAKSELLRQAAATQLAANIDMAKQMALNSQMTGLNIAQNAGQAMGQA